MDERAMSEYVYCSHGEPLANDSGEIALARKEIVRCRDCKYYHDGISNGRRYAEPYCLAIGELAYGALFEVDEDCFCSWGERKEVD